MHKLNYWVIKPSKVKTINSNDDQIGQHHLIINFELLHILILTICHLNASRTKAWNRTNTFQFSNKMLLLADRFQIELTWIKIRRRHEKTKKKLQKTSTQRTFIEINHHCPKNFTPQIWRGCKIRVLRRLERARNTLHILPSAIRH